MADGRSRNERIIDEFRANGGRVGGRFEGRPMLLLHHTGARTGRERVNPLVYQALDGGGELAVFASAGGAPDDPAWYRNVRANPDVTVEVGTETLPARARVAERAERDRIWARQIERNPAFAEYETRTARVIPVVVLELAGR